MALDFPSLAEIPNQNPENTYSPTSTPKASTNGLTYVWNGKSWDLIVATGTGGGGIPEAPNDNFAYSRKNRAWDRNYYLSSEDNDTAKGEITFQGLTTHEAGVSVTGGSAAGVDDGLFAGSNFGGPILTSGSGGVQLSMDKTGGGETIARSHGIEITFADDYIGRENNSTCYGMALTSPSTLTTTRADQQYFGFTSNVEVTSAVRTAYCYFGDVSASSGVTDTAAVYYANADKDINPKAYNFFAGGNAPSYFAGTTVHAGGTTVSGDQSYFSPGEANRDTEYSAFLLRPDGSTTIKATNYIGFRSQHQNNVTYDVSGQAIHFLADGTGIGDVCPGNNIAFYANMPTTANLGQRNWAFFSQNTAPSLLKGGIQFDDEFDASTGASNQNLLLDYYETGVFFPRLESSDGSFSAVYNDAGSQGRYTKIGNRVQVDGRIECTSTNSTGNSLRIINLPFNCVNSINEKGCGSIGIYTGFAVRHPESLIMLQNNNKADIQYYDSPSTSANVRGTDCGSGGIMIQFSVSYFAPL